MPITLLKMLLPLKE